MYDKNNEEFWENVHLESGVYNVGEKYPEVEFDFYVEGLSEKNAYFSNEGIKRQIDELISLKPERTKVVYFYYKRTKHD